MNIKTEELIAVTEAEYTQAKILVSNFEDTINILRSQLTIECQCCKKHWHIHDLTYYQTVLYMKPHGCVGGDYFYDSEGYFMCPDTDIRNRLLFMNTHDVPYNECSKIENNPAMQFKHIYKCLFAKIVKVHAVDGLAGINTHNLVNNEYVAKHLTKFGLHVKFNETLDKGALKK